MNPGGATSFSSFFVRGGRSVAGLPVAYSIIGGLSLISNADINRQKSRETSRGLLVGMEEC